MDEYYYAREKLWNVLRCLAIGEGDVRERLLCSRNDILLLSERDFPEDLRNEFVSIRKQLIKYGPKYDQGGNKYLSSVAHTMKRIKKKTGAEIAEKVFDLYFGIDEVISQQ